MLRFLACVALVFCCTNGRATQFSAPRPVATTGTPRVQSEASVQFRPYEPFALLSPDRSELVLAMPEARLVFVDIAGARVRLETRLQRRGEGSEADIRSMSWSPDGKRLAVEILGSPVQIVDRLRGDSRIEVPMRERWCSGVQWTTDDRLLLSYYDVASELWSVDRGERIAELATRAGPACAFALSRDRGTLALGDTTGEVSVWDAGTGSLRVRLPSRGKRVHSLAFDPQGSSLAIGDAGRDLRVWSLECDEERLRLSYPGDDPFDSIVTRGISFSPDGRLLVSTSSDWWDVHLWSLDDGKERWRFASPEGWPPGIAARFSTDGSLVLLSRYGLGLDAESGMKRQVLWGGGDTSTRVRWDRDLAWSFVDCRLQVYSLRDGGRLVVDLPIDD
jgi:WD40 repeat protein